MATMRRMRNPNELFVGDLSFFCREQHLIELFSSCGGVVDARIKRSDAKGKTLMYGFVRMDTLKGALTAAKELNGYIFMGRTMKVQLSLTNTYHDHTQVVLQGYQVHSSFTSFFPNDAIIEPDEGKLRRLYEPFGEVYDIVVKEYIVHHKEQRQEGYGFITFATEEQAHYAASQCACVIVDGIRIESTISHRSRTHDPAIPGYPLNNNNNPPPQLAPQPPPPRSTQYDLNPPQYNHSTEIDYRVAMNSTDSVQYPQPMVSANNYSMMSQTPSYMPPLQQHQQQHHQQQQQSQQHQHHLPMSSVVGMNQPMNGMNHAGPPATFANQYPSPQLSHMQQSLNKPTSTMLPPPPQHNHFQIPQPPVMPPPASYMGVPSGTGSHMSHHNPNVLSNIPPAPPIASQPPPTSSSMFFPSNVPTNMYPMQQPPSFPGIIPQSTQIPHSSSPDISVDGSVSRLYMPPPAVNPPLLQQHQQQYGHHDPSSLFRSNDSGMISNVNTNNHLFVNPQPQPYTTSPYNNFHQPPANTFTGFHH